jgi:hypothetical protein
MENKINKKVEQYIDRYRETVRREIMGLEIESRIQNKILETLYTFETLHLEKEDFMKRKRIVSQVAGGDRCIAKKANGEQCTRKKKETCSFCGTHEKCQPHGVISITKNEKTMKRCCITIMDINGINYYVDDNNNVYNTADILSNSNNPNIIGRLSKIDGKIELHLM